MAAGSYKVDIVFKLNKEGKIIGVKAKGPHYLLEKEAIRVVKLLPQITLAKVDGKPVTVHYAIPIYLTVSY